MIRNGKTYYLICSGIKFLSSLLFFRPCVNILDREFGDKQDSVTVELRWWTWTNVYGVCGVDGADWVDVINEADGVGVADSRILCIYVKVLVHLI